MIYNLFAVHIKIIENERKNMVRKHRKKHVYDSKELIAKNRFVEEIQEIFNIGSYTKNYRANTNKITNL